jgi:hypothetical protein
MRITMLGLEPGDRVRLNKDEYCNFDPNEPIYLTATRGSVGTVVSFDDYRAGRPASELQRASQEGYEPILTSSFSYPVRFESVLPPANPEASVKCHAGDTDLIFVNYLEKLDALDRALLFILERVRVIYLGEGQPFAASQGHKLLLVDFTLENQSSSVLRYCAHAPRVWLTCAGAPGEEVLPLRLDLPSGLEPRERRTGQAIFQVPAAGCVYRFFLELRDVGRVEREIRVLDLPPGTMVSVAGRTYAGRYGTFRTYFINSSWGQLATRGSWGMIVPFAQFRAAYRHRLLGYCETFSPEDEAAFEWGCAQAQGRMEACLAYPVQLWKVEPPSSTDRRSSWADEFCQAGDIVWVDGVALEPAPADKPKPVLLVTRVQGVAPEEKVVPGPEPGHKWVIVDFALEGLPAERLPALADARLRLTWAAGELRSEEGTAAPVRVAPAAEDLQHAGALLGQATFEVPRGTFDFVVSLEVAGAGGWEARLQAPRFQPGDRVFDTFCLPPVAKNPGTVISFAEYCAAYERQPQPAGEAGASLYKWPAQVKEEMETGRGYPVRLDRAQLDYTGKPLYPAGHICVVDVAHLKLMK